MTMTFELEITASAPEPLPTCASTPSDQSDHEQSMTKAGETESLDQPITPTSQVAVLNKRPSFSDISTHSSDVSSTTLPSPASTPQHPAAKSSWRWSNLKCTSGGLNTIVGTIAFCVGVYYFWVQYVIAEKAFVIGIWKDCHDRSVRA